LFSNTKSSIDNVLSNTSSGGVTINDLVYHNILLDCPFGGVGDSGIGQYNGQHSFDTFSHKKTILHKTMRIPDPPVRFPPYTAWKRSTWKLLMSIETGEFKRNLFFYIKSLILMFFVVLIAMYFYKK